MANSKKMFYWFVVNAIAVFSVMAVVHYHEIEINSMKQYVGPDKYYHTTLVLNRFSYWSGVYYSKMAFVLSSSDSPREILSITHDGRIILKGKTLARDKDLAKCFREWNEQYVNSFKK